VTACPAGSLDAAEDRNRIGGGYMAHTHEFDCKLCSAHLDSRDELDRHNRLNHRESMEAGGTARGMERPRQSSPPSRGEGRMS
jgi:hypothetical protein